MQGSTAFAILSAKINKIDGTEAEHYSELAEEAARNAAADAEHVAEAAAEIDSLDERVTTNTNDIATKTALSSQNGNVLTRKSDGLFVPELQADYEEDTGNLILGGVSAETSIDELAEEVSQLNDDLADNIGYQKLAFDFVKGAYFGGNIADFKLTEHIAEGVYWSRTYDNSIYVQSNTSYSCFSIRIKPNTTYTFTNSRYVVLSIDGVTKNGSMLENVTTFDSGENNFAFISVSNNAYSSYVINEGTSTDISDGYCEIPLLKTKSYIDNTTIIKSKNLFDDNDVVDGFLSGASGAITVYSDWKSTGYIPVEYGKYYYATCYGSNSHKRNQDTMKYLHEFGADKSYISKKDSGLGQREAYTPSSANVKYVRWSFHSSNVSNYLFEETYGGTGYEEKGEKEVFIRDNLIGAYNGIKWGCFGDSLTDINIYANNHYHDWISKVDGFKVANYGYSGTGYKNGNASGIDFVTRMSNIIPSTFDFMTVMGTFNDASLISSSFPIGTKTDSGTDTLCGCINATIDAYYSVARNKPIGFITPPPTLYRNPTNNTAEQIVQAIIDICEYRCIPYLDLYHEIGLNVWYGTDEQKQAYLTSFFTENEQTDTNGIHPNSIAHKLFIAPKVREFVHNLVMPN